MINLILSTIAITIFIAYNIVALCLFGMPCSLSNTFYLYNWKTNHPNWKCNNLGYLFTAMMFVCALLFLPAWLNLTETITEWSHYLTFLPFLAAGGICFTGAAPAFRNGGMEEIVHYTGAGVSAVFSLLWCFIVCYKLAWIVPLVILICGGIAHLTKTAKKGRDWWLEMSAFMSVFIITLIECILQL